MHDSFAQIRTVVAAGVLLVLLAWEIGHPFFEQFGRDRQGWRKRGLHAGFNLGLGLLNALIVSAVFVGAWAAATTWTGAASFGLLNSVNMPSAVRWLAAIILLDAWTYAWHWMNHAVPFFWRFHRLHHSDRAMDVTTATRFHTVEIAASSILRVPVFVILGVRIDELAVYEVLLFACVQFHHANIALPERLDRVLRWVIVTPFMHKVHHSVKMTEANSNYGSLFTWWDRIFRTMRWVRDPRAIVFGVDDTAPGAGPKTRS